MFHSKMLEFIARKYVIVKYGRRMHGI